MSSQYVVLGDRSLDQWKVTELKEELKKRKLTIGGLKADLVKRLDESVRLEQEESGKENVDNGLSSGIQSELPSEQEISALSVVSGTGHRIHIGMDSTWEVNSGPANEMDGGRLLDKGKVVEGDIVKETSIAGSEQEQSVQYAGSETTVVLSETVDSVTTVTETFLPSDRANEMADLTAGLDNDAIKPQEDARPEPCIANNEFPRINQNSMPVLSPTRSTPLDSETQNDAPNSTIHPKNNESSSLLLNQFIPLPNNQISKVDLDFGSQVISDYVSTESVSLIEKNEPNVDVVNDTVKLELDVKHKQPLLNSVAPYGGELHPMDVEEPLDKKDVEEPLNMEVLSVGDNSGSYPEIDDSDKNTNAGDLDLSEKLSLDRSSEDDFMEDDVLDSKQEYKSNESKTIDYIEKSETFGQKEENFVDVVGNGQPLETDVVSAEQKTVPTLSSSKRKFDKEVVGNNNTAKRARRWNAEEVHKSSEPQSVTTADSAAPDDSSQPTFKRFSRSNSLVNEEPPKERVVLPSSEPPTNSLRIDQFLRPFTLKAVQELLGKTGTFNRFWMDQIKTHCYVSYSSVEEAVDTRNAVYNLQWPTNGGRLLVAEFVDPEEVKKHVEGPPASQGALATPPSNATPVFSAQQHGTAPPQPSPWGQVSRQKLPPPPTSKPLVRGGPHPLREPTAISAKDRINLLPPPPPPLVTEVEPPSVTLDDLFRKTKAIPRIYYLPLSDEQVAAKKLIKGNANQ